MVAQILALAIFVVMFGLIISEKFERHVITLVCGLATLVLVFGVAMHSMDAILETLNIRNILHFRSGMRQEPHPRVRVVSTGPRLSFLRE